MLKSPLRYPGGKSRLAPTLLSKFPKDFSEDWEFREPFVGGGSVFFAVKQKYPNAKFWINDLNPEVSNFWRVVRDDLGGLVFWIESMREFYADDGRKMYDSLKNNNKYLEEVDWRAARFFLLNRITFSGTSESGGYSEQAFQTRLTDSSIKNLKKLSGVLEGVKITGNDFKCLVNSRSTREKCLMFLDPPYLLTKEKNKLYGKNGDLHKGFDHKELAESLSNAKNQWIMTYNDSQIISLAYKNNEIEEINLTYSMKNNNKVRELLIKNY